MSDLPEYPKIGDQFRPDGADAVYVFVGPTTMKVGDELKKADGVTTGIYAGKGWAQVFGCFKPLQTQEIGPQGQKPVTGSHKTKK